MGRVAKARNAHLRDLYSHNTSHIRSWQKVFVDESGCDKWAGQWRTGWAPLWKNSYKSVQIQREQRYQILPAYTQDGVICTRVFQGSTHSTVFEDFIEQTLLHMNSWPEENSVLIMNNASIHRTEQIKQICCAKRCEANISSAILARFQSDRRVLRRAENFY